MNKVNNKSKMMVSLIVIYTVIAFFNVSCAETVNTKIEADMTAPASLIELIRIAKENNSQLKAAHERVLRAEAELSEAKANMGPKAGIAAGGTWAQNDMSMHINGQNIPLLSRNIYATAVGFMHTLYAGGSFYASKQAAEFSRDAIKAEEIRASQSVENSVRNAFYNIKRAKAKELVAKEAVFLTKEHMEKTEQLFKAGVIAKGDVLRTKVTVAESKMNLIKAENTTEIMIATLERVVGTVVDLTFMRNNTNTYKVQKWDTTEEISDSSNSYLDQAYENRQELKVYDLLSKQAEKIARAAKGQKLPQIIATGSLSNTGNEFLPKNNEEWRLSLGAYWTLFDSGRVSAQTEQAKAKAREFLHMIDDSKNEIKMEVTQAEKNLLSAESRLKFADSRVNEAEEDYRITMRRYEEQVGTNLDVLDARLSLTNSRTDLVDALYDIEIAKANLIYSIGL